MLDLGLLLAQLVVVLLAARVAGALVRLVGQPPVVGEMLAASPSAPRCSAPSRRRRCTRSSRPMPSSRSRR